MPFNKKYSRTAAEVKTVKVRVRQRKSALLLGLLLVLAPAARADEFGKISSDIAKAASRYGKKRIAILPFQGLGGKEATSGVIVAERLVGHILSRGTVEVVERTLLTAVMREQRLELSGVADPGSVRELGKVLGVDAIVTGTVTGLKNDRLEVNARLIDAETARVLSATIARIDKDWNESLFDGSLSFGLPVPPLPDFELSAPLFASDGDLGGEGGCGDLDRRVDALERSAVDLKARYWAGRLKEKDFSRASLKVNPGSEIRNPEIRSQFYGTLKKRFDENRASKLSQEEWEQLSAHDSRIKRLTDSCQSGGA